MNLSLSSITFYINFHLLEITGKTWLRRRSSQYFARPTDKWTIPKSEKRKDVKTDEEGKTHDKLHGRDTKDNSSMCVSVQLTKTTLIGLIVVCLIRLCPAQQKQQR